MRPRAALSASLSQGGSGISLARARASHAKFFARKDRKAPYRDNEWKPGEDVPLTLIMHMKCRACPDCRRLRRREWYLRAGIELSRCKRSWFGTLTLSPESAFRCEVFARRRLLSGGTIWEQLRPKDRYGELCHQVGSK